LKKWLPFITVFFFLALIVSPLTAAEWKLFEKTPLNEIEQEGSIRLLGSETTTAHTNSIFPSGDPLIRFEEKMIPLSVNQLKLSFTDLSPQNTSTLSAPQTDKSPQLSVNTSLQALSLQGAPTTQSFSAETNWTVSTLVLFFGVNLNIGPGYFQGRAFAIQPPENFNHLNPTSDLGILQGELDGKAKGFNAAAGYKFNNRFSLEAGIGHVEQDRNRIGNIDDAWGIYAQAILNLAPGVQVIPEIGQIDFDKGKLKNTTVDNFYAGAKWEINF
jgi:hypothetical protein